MTNQEQVENFLQNNQIDYKIHQHPPVFTSEQAEKHSQDIPGTAGKNLFLKDQKKQRYFLIIMPGTKRADLKALAEKVGEKKLSFANEQELEEKLGLKPGAVSPFGLINDQDKKAEVYIDQEIYDKDIVNFHPNVNTASLELTKQMFHRYLELIPHDVKIINL